MVSPAEEAAQLELTQLISTLRSLREGRRDLPRRLLASRLGIATGSVVDWELARNVPTTLHLLGWVRELDMRLGLFDANGTEDRSAVEPVDGESWQDCEMRRLAVALRIRRKAARISQVIAAERAATSQRLIAYWESSKGNPRPLGLLMWVSALDCSLRLLPMAS